MVAIESRYNMSLEAFETREWVFEDPGETGKAERIPVSSNVWSLLPWKSRSSLQRPKKLLALALCPLEAHELRSATNT